LVNVDTGATLPAFTVTATSAGTYASSADAEVTPSVSEVNDAATISTGSGAVTEDLDLTDSGQLFVSDPDAGESIFTTQTNTTTQYGSFSITEDGNWIYELNNSNATVKALDSGEQLTERVEVTSVDGTESYVDITINGISAPITYTGNAAWMMSTSGGRSEGYSFKPKISGGDSITFSPNGSIFWDFIVDVSTSDWDGDLSDFDVIGLGDPTLTTSSSLVANNGQYAIVRIALVNTSSSDLTIDNSAKYQFEIQFDSGSPLTENDVTLVSSDVYVRAHNDGSSDHDLGLNPALVLNLESKGVFYDTAGSNSVMDPEDLLPNQIILGRDGADMIYGEGGNDVLIGGNDSDFIFGGLGDDTMTGDDGADMFVWKSTDVDAGTDTITDFTPTEGDVLDISDILTRETYVTDDNGITSESVNSLLNNFLDITQVGSNVKIDVQSLAGGAVTQSIVLENTNFDTLAGSSGATDADVLKSLIDGGNLDIDNV